MIKNKLEILKQKPYIIGLLIILFILIIYLPAMNTFLIGDDFDWLNSCYSSWQDPSQLFREINNFFRPMVKFTYLLDYTFFKTRAPYYNSTTLLIHLANLFLLYYLLVKVTRRITPAAVITLVYGSSALYSEVPLWAAGRPDSLLLLFMLLTLILLYSLDEKKQIPRYLGIFLFTLCAAGSKVTWMLLPFLAVGLLWLVKQRPLKATLKSTLGMFVLMAAYVSYFIILPKLSGAAAFTSYGEMTFEAAIKKFSYLVFKYIGLAEASTGVLWQITLTAIVIAALTYWLIMRKNRLALYGLLWMLMTIGISLPIYYAPSRYNYLPLLGFWIMIIAWLEKDIKDFIKKFKIKNSIALLLIVVPILFYLTHQVIMVQKEIRDYRQIGAAHKMLIDMYLKVKDQIHQHRPVVFINLGKRRALDELNRSLQGYRKLLFKRKDAIWQMVFLAPLANFVGHPFSTLMKPIPAAELETVFQQGFTTLVFTDNGFFLSDAYAKIIRNFYQQNRRLPAKVQALRFMPVTACK